MMRVCTLACFSLGFSGCAAVTPYPFGLFYTDVKAPSPLTQFEAQGEGKTGSKVLRNNDGPVITVLQQASFRQPPAAGRYKIKGLVGDRCVNAKDLDAADLIAVRGKVLFGGHNHRPRDHTCR